MVPSPEAYVQAIICVLRVRGSEKIRDTPPTPIDTSEGQISYAFLRMFYISTTQYNILTRICKGLCVKIRYKFQQFYRNLTHSGFQAPENRDERDVVAVYPVVIVPSALTRIVTPGNGLRPDGPCPGTWLKPLAGSKTALCAGQTICCWPEL